MRLFESKTFRVQIVSRTLAILAAIIQVFATLAPPGLLPHARKAQTSQMKPVTSFDDAFKVLDDAINDQEAPTLKSLIDEEVRVLKTQVTLDNVIHALETEVRANPALFIGGAAACALAAGFLLAQRGNA